MFDMKVAAVWFLRRLYRERRWHGSGAPAVAPRRVHDVDDAGRECGGQGLRDDRAGRGPGEDLDLAGRVDEHVLEAGGLHALLQEAHDLPGRQR